ncbi:FimV/HubP family polar landmark protein [Psychrobacter urativorans]|uniref:Pilus assembly protein FimV n=1 Tax=Psychrobacter urativorans TaxID=45610 RepID=A0A0M5MJV3_9GAMM|nr:FimV/HubP family polar landmark protein [Psychrobacter urativorans]ALF59068.1 hypothetical protein AOC03_02585 [Psychrobacter urativorans]
MNNILYIIAGLVIISMVGVWILRKKKAQQPSISPRARAGSRDSANATALVTENNPATQRAANSVASSATKFDNVTIAQRFIDQQRYDKAIETLERGLTEKPHDGELSLKLLNVYALTKQTEEFNSTYATIKAHCDVATIAQAQQLKDLLDAEQVGNSPASFDTSSITESSMILNDEMTLSTIKVSNPTTDSKNDDMSLDFDISTPVIKHEEIITPTASTNSDHTFDLTLDDLETYVLEEGVLKNNNTKDTLENISAESEQKVAIINLDSINKLNDTNNIDTIFVDTSSVDTNSTNNNYDFTLDFDLGADSTSTTLIEDDKTNEPTPIDDDFVLDFDDLVEEVKFKEIEVESAQQPVATVTNQQAFDDDFTLFLDATAYDPSATNTETTSTTASIHDSSQDLNLDSDSLESSLHDTLTQAEVLHVTDELTNSDDLIALDFIDADVDLDTNKAATSNAITPALDDQTLTFDDDTGIDEFDFNTDTTSITTTSPVTSENSRIDSDSAIKDTLPSADVAAQFAADFDFVNTLDNHQVTLDLANQYLQLGEYDSAKRLLNEVVAQGNPEQQQQAQELLARAA